MRDRGQMKDRIILERGVEAGVIARTVLPAAVSPGCT